MCIDRSVLCALCRTKALVLELLAAVCLVSGGHDIILSAFDNFKEVGHLLDNEDDNYGQMQMACLSCFAVSLILRA